MQTFGPSPEIFSVRGKKAVVTGGTRGLGKAMATVLMENGCDVLVVSRNSASREELEAAAAENRVQVHFHACDIADPAAVEIAIAVAAKQMGRIDILINAAGINILKPLTEMDDESFERVIHLNVTANFRVLREAAKVMKAQGYGKIINMSSIRSLLGASDIGYIAYASSKSAVNMLTKQAACELAAHGITVNAIAATFIKTAMNAAQLENEDFRKSLEARIPVGRIGQFQDLAGLTLLLSSDASSFITGQIFLLDGGISARQ